MNSFSILSSQVKSIVDDPSVTDEDVLTEFNHCLSIFAEKVKPYTLAVTMEEVESDSENIIELPDHLTGNILSLYDESYRSIQISKRAIDAEHVLGTVFIGSKKLFAIGIYSGSTLKIFSRENIGTKFFVSYLKKPDLFSSVTDDGSSILFITGSLAELMLVHYAASNIYSKIEDGITDKRLNSQVHLAMYSNYMKELELLYLSESNQKRPETVMSIDIFGTN